MPPEKDCPDLSAPPVAVQLAWMGRTSPRWSRGELTQGWMSLLYNLAVIDAVMLPLTISALASRNCELEHKGSTWKLWGDRDHAAAAVWGQAGLGSDSGGRHAAAAHGAPEPVGAGGGVSDPDPLGEVAAFLCPLLWGEFCDLCLAAGPVPLVCQPGGAAGGADFRQLCGAVALFFPQWVQRCVIWGYYGVLIQAGMNWDPVTRATEFYWVQTRPLEFGLLALWMIVVLAVGRGLFVRKEV